MSVVPLSRSYSTRVCAVELSASHSGLARRPESCRSSGEGRKRVTGPFQPSVGRRSGVAVDRFGEFADGAVFVTPAVSRSDGSSQPADTPDSDAVSGTTAERYRLRGAPVSPPPDVAWPPSPLGQLYLRGCSRGMRVVDRLNKSPVLHDDMGELETEAQKTRGEVATYLRGLADQLDEGGAVTLELGNRRVELDPVDPVTFKLEGESDWTEGDTEAKQSIEFELVWRQDARTAEEGSLNVERTEPE